MKLGFDIDGVLCGINMVNLNLMDIVLTTKQQEQMEVYYYDEMQPQLNPELFVGDDDTYYIITGRHEGLRKITERWVEKYCPHVQELYMVGGTPWYKCNDVEHIEVHKSSAEKKADIINKIGIEWFIDDSPKVVKILRELCPNTVVMQYGGRSSY